MSRELIGKANHVFNQDEIVNIDVHLLELEVRPDEEKFVITIGDSDGRESIIINSMEQWEQLNALVRKAFDGLSED